jgi:hypothetical protein
LATLSPHTSNPQALAGRMALRRRVFGGFWIVGRSLRAFISAQEHHVSWLDLQV